MTAIEILQAMEGSTRVEICTNSGEIVIDSNTHEFTYVGTFGKIISSMILKHNCMNDLAKKLIIVAENCEAYSRIVSGVTMLSFVD